MATFDKSPSCVGPDGKLMTKLEEIGDNFDSHLRRFKSTGSLPDLHDFLSSAPFYISALQASSDSHPDLTDLLRPKLAGVHASLGDAYAELSTTSDNPDAFNQALKHYLRAMELTPAGDPNLPKRRLKLAHSYTTRFESLRKKEDLNMALDLMLSVINSTKPDDPALGSYRNDLASLYRYRFREDRDLDSLKSAIEWTELTLEGVSPDDLSFTHLWVVLFRLQADLTSKNLCNTDDLSSAQKNGIVVDEIPGELLYTEKALQVCQTALRAAKPDDSRLPDLHRGLSTFYFSRSTQLNNHQDLELALKHATAAVECCPAGDPRLLTYQTSLGELYSHLFGTSGHPADIATAIEWIERALHNTPPNHGDLRPRQISLAECYDVRYTALSQLDDLEMAIKLKQSSLENMPASPPIRSCWTYTALASSYTKHFDAVHDLKSLDLAIQYYTKALDQTQPDDGHFGCQVLFLASTLDQKSRALGWDRELDERAVGYYKQLIESPNPPTPANIWGAGLRWGQINSRLDIPDCLDGFAAAFNALRKLVWVGNPIGVRHDELRLFKIPTATAAAAAVSIKFDRPELAIEFVEQGLAITYRQMLQLRDDASMELVEKHPELATQLRQVSSHLQQQMEDTNTASSQPESPGFSSPHLLTIERDRLLRKIRGLEGFETFLLPHTFNHLSCAAQEGPVVVVTCPKFSPEQWPDRGHAIIVVAAHPHAHTKVVPLPELTEKSAKQILGKLKQALEVSRIKSRSSNSALDRAGRRFQQEKLNSEKLFRGVMDMLRTSIVEPVFQTLKESGIESGRIWWCPTGILTYLPLHAAGADGPYTQSYTLTLDALIQSRKKPASSRPSMTVLAVPEISGQPQLSLPCVTTELERMASIAKKHNLAFTDLTAGEATATPGALATYIQTASWLHLACHGEQDSADPLASRLRLRDGSLELKQIIATDSGLRDAQFVFLSACQTAMGDGDIPNEAMHMAGAFMAAGFKGAVGTLWSIADADGPVVAEAFYEKLIGAEVGVGVDSTVGLQGTGLVVERAAEALKAAVDKLRAQGAPFERWVPFMHFGI